jgi:hypothetical protein
VIALIQCDILLLDRLADPKIDRKVKENRMSDKKITVYVRLGGDPNDRNIPEVRTLSFKAPDEIPQKVAIGQGFAVDGNSYIMDTAAYWMEDTPDHRYVPLAEALRDTQMDIIRFLGEYGYEVTFD